MRCSFATSSSSSAVRLFAVPARCPANPPAPGNFSPYALRKPVSDPEKSARAASEGSTEVSLRTPP